MNNKFILAILYFPKLYKSLILLFALTFFDLFLFNNSAYSATLPSCNSVTQFLAEKRSPGVNCLADCNSMPSGITANEGTNCLYACDNLPAGRPTAQIGTNCAFKFNGHVLPFCNPIPSQKTPSTASYFLTVGTEKKPRLNCLDLIDLPLCSMVTSSPLPLKNCVPTCSSLSPTPTIDNRIFNRDCIRFCNALESGVTATADNCIIQKCYHLIGTGITPAPDTNKNCEISTCTTLNENELKHSSLYSGSTALNKYCDNTDQKCLLFTLGQLNAIKSGYDSAITEKSGPLFKFCQRHTCRVDPSGSCAPHASDDTAKISENGSYSAAYINAIIKTTSPALTLLSELCQVKSCRGKIEVQFQCTGSTMNSQCNIGACDADGMCKRSVDCDSQTLIDSDRKLYCDGTPKPDSPPANDFTNSYPDLINKSWFYLPKPMDKSYKVNGSGAVDYSLGFREMSDDLCYSINNLLTSGFGYEDNNASFLSGAMSFFTGKNFRPYFHNYLTMDTRSPNYCSPATRLGDRGLGYSYLCGGPNFTSKPNMDYVGYIDNITSMWTGISASHKVRVCLRYNNSMIPGKTCGARECGITCFCEDCSTVCGSDVCRDVIVNDSELRACEDPTSASGGCVAQIGGGADIDSYIRVRAVGFESDNRICVMLDWKGGLARNGMFMNGTESLAEDSKKCLSGTYSESTKTCINGKNSNDDAGSATVWRALGLIKYIDQNTTSSQGAKGIRDIKNNFYNEANCIRKQINTSPPNFYNIANNDNSPGLFSPPLIINSAKKKIGGATSVSENISQNLFGATDFNQPEVEILFGNTTTLISLNVGKNGDESGANADINAKKTIETTAFGKTYTATIYGKKTSDPFGNPQFCIFRELRDKNNVLLDPAPSIGCVRRNPPEIDNCDVRDGLCVAPPASPRESLRKKIVLNKDLTTANNDYKNIDVRFKYFTHYNDPVSKQDCTGNALCSNELSVKFNLSNRNGMSYCYSTTLAPEGYPICFTRDDCSILNMECMENEIAISTGNVVDSALSTHEECYQKLLTCNKKKNITSRDYDPTKFNAISSDNYYGWFNEVCITKGFNHKLRTVYAYRFDTQNGECIVDPIKKTAGVDCSAGGKMPDCPCTEYTGGATPANVQAISSINRTERLETPHEAGLCVDIELPKTCPSINYLVVENTANPDDRFFLINSLNKLAASLYNDSTGVHSTHQYRTEGKTTPPTIPLRGNAEFNATIAGGSARGTCNGFWKHKIRSGAKVYPRLTCNLNVATGVASWNNSLADDNDACERYLCPEISSPAGLNNATGLYDNNYGVDEIGENKGLSHGYAYWDQVNLATDFAITKTASACITGFKSVRSEASIDYSSASASSKSTDIDASKKTLANASLFSAITGYSVVTLPSRICNQIGAWQTVEDSCQRITCPAINPGIAVPASDIDKKFWQRSWELSGGAKFPEGKASRSSTTIITASGLSSRVTGTCEGDLGYYSPPSGSPTLDCDHLGNWTNLQNHCLNSCSEISRANTNSGNGFAKWLSAILNQNQNEITFTGSCTDDPNYFNYPYPHRLKPNGKKYDLVPSGANYSSTIPDNISSDTRAGAGAANTAPQRLCSKSIYSGGGNTSKWGGVSATCITTLSGMGLPNGCVTGVASDDLMSDERIGAGVTRHTLNGGTIVDIPWSRRNFGEYELKYCDSTNNYCRNSSIGSDSEHNSNSYYAGSRSSRFILSRYCDPATKKWNDPVPYCAARGDLGNSLNSWVNAPSISMDGKPNNYIIGLGVTLNTNCNSNYTANPSTPQIQCQYGQSGVIDTLQLTKIDTNQCTRYCVINSDGTPAGSSYSQLRGSPGNYFPGASVTLTCGSGNPCGSQTVTASCNGDGSWNIPTPGCRACDNCNSSSGNNLTNDPTTSSSVDSGNLRTILTRTITQSCVEERASVKCLLLKAQASSKLDRRNYDKSTTRNLSFPTITHGNIVRVSNHRGVHCGASNTDYQQVCVQSVFLCNDGKFEYYWDESNKGDCNYEGEYEDGNDSMDACMTNDKKFVTRSVSDRLYRNVGCYNYSNSNLYEIIDDCLK